MWRGYGGVRRGHVFVCSVAMWLARRAAVRGSNPARPAPLSWFSPENPGTEKYRSRFSPAQQQEIPAQDEYFINTVDRKLEK